MLPAPNTGGPACTTIYFNGTTNVDAVAAVCIALWGAILRVRRVVDAAEQLPERVSADRADAREGVSG